MPDESAVTPPNSETPPAPVPEVNKDALEVGELLLNSGYTKDQINDLMAAPGALASFKHVLENDPVKLIEMLEKNDPVKAKSVHDKLAQSYIERYDRKDVKNDLATELKRTNERIDAQERDRQQRDLVAGAQVIKQRYDARVDELMGALPADLKLTKSEKESLKAKLNFDINADPQALERVARGNFIDVPKKFKDLADSWSGDRKQAAAQEKEARDKVAGKSFSELQSGPGVFAVEQSALDKSLEGAGDDWEATIQALGSGLSRS